MSTATSREQHKETLTAVQGSDKGSVCTGDALLEAWSQPVAKALRRERTAKRQLKPGKLSPHSGVIRITKRVTTMEIFSMNIQTGEKRS